jgi:hypothetical protein
MPRFDHPLSGSRAKLVKPQHQDRDRTTEIISIPSLLTMLRARFTSGRRAELKQPAALSSPRALEILETKLPRYSSKESVAEDQSATVLVEG